jgi:hypothetical protein
MADIDLLMPLIKQFMPFAQERMGFKEPPRLFLKGDANNASNPLGRTAFYDPAERAVTVYITSRHPKDILRSISHELVHHTQNCNGDFSDAGEMGEGYAQKNPHMREMERQAYEIGNMCFRDWEDSIKQTIYHEHLNKGDYTMSTKDWKNKEMKSLLSEAWGFKMNLNMLNEEYTGSGDDHMGDDNEEAKEETEGKNDPVTEAHCDDDELKEGDTGASKGDDSKTHPGEKDYTTKKDDELKDTEDGGARGEKKGDKAYVNEDSGAEEGEHYEMNAMSDEEHIKAIERHLAALKHDRDYDEEHIEEEQDTVEEGGLADRPENAHRMGPGRGRRANESQDRESKLRAMVREAIKEAMK